MEPHTVIHIEIPFGPNFARLDATKVVTPFLAANLGLGLSESAYMAEIFRGGIQSAPIGQSDAARALGLRRSTDPVPDPADMPGQFQAEEPAPVILLGQSRAGSTEPQPGPTPLMPLNSSYAGAACSG